MKPSWVLASDLDGTLLRPDGSVSEATKAGLAAASDRGGHVVFVTGRPPRFMPAVVAATGLAGVAICANGSLTVDLANHQVLSAHYLAAEAVAEARDRILRLLGPGSSFGVEFAPIGPVEASGFYHDPEFAPVARTGAKLHDFVEPLPSTDVIKLLARSKPASVADQDHLSPTFHVEIADLVATAAQVLGDLGTVSHSSRTQLLLEVAPLGVTKATGIAELAQLRLGPGVPLLAVGDMPNDIPMLELADRSFAVASAHPSVLAVADEIIPDPEHDGVLQLIKSL
jgi:hydroxymethylpyrimidine pyrophosphatase-like HAD family hydrolase